MEPKARRLALRMITYGLYVLGVADGDARELATVSWVTQASFKPPLVVVCLRKKGRPFEILRRSRVFTLTMLAADQAEVARAFFGEARFAGDRANGYEVQVSSRGAPILAQAPAWLEADVVSIDDRGDHAVVLGRIVEAYGESEVPPLTLADLGLRYGG